MGILMANNGGEPSSAPQPERWYELRLGSSFKDRPSSKFCTLRYEFKPASIDKNQAGMLRKTKDNRVTVEFNNNQPGKPKVAFEGTSEDYKDNDGVLFFDGESFRLERLHRAVKRLRHVRSPGEFPTAVSSASVVTNAPAADSRSPQLAKTMKSQTLSKQINHVMPLEVERIDIGDPDSSGFAKHLKTSSDIYSTPPNPFSTSPYDKTHEQDDNVDILEEDDGSPPKSNFVGFDINMPNQVDTDDEIADVDVSDDEANKGPNAAEALRAQVNATEEGQQQQHHEQDESSSSSGSSGTGSSGSGSGSSSSDSDDSDGDSATSGGDIDI